MSAFLPSGRSVWGGGLGPAFLGLILLYDGRRWRILVPVGIIQFFVSIWVVDHGIGSAARPAHVLAESVAEGFGAIPVELHTPVCFPTKEEENILE